MIHHLALIGDPPESRDHRGRPGIPPMIHRDARIEAFASIDGGTERATRFGRSWAFKHSHIGHDAIVGDECEIGDNVKIGLNATIRPRVKIGDGARVGMGAVVVRDVPAGEVHVGNPARNIQTDPRIDPAWDDWYLSRDRSR